MDKIDCYQIVGIKLTVTPKCRNKDDVFVKKKKKKIKHLYRLVGSEIIFLFIFVCWFVNINKEDFIYIFILVFMKY